MKNLQHGLKKYWCFHLNSYIAIHVSGIHILSLYTNWSLILTTVECGLKLTESPGFWQFEKKNHWNFSTKHTNFNYKMQLLRPLRKNLENPKNTSYVLVAFHHFNYCLDCINVGFFVWCFLFFFWKGGGGNVIHARLFFRLSESPGKL